MQITQLKGKKWAIGLDWEILAGDLAIKLEAKDVAEKTNCNYGLLIDYDGQFALGLSPKASKEPSASLYLALANQETRASDGMDNYPDWIVVEEVGDDKYWMGVVKNGLPAPQFDAVFDITTIKEKFGELIVNDTYKFFSPCGEIISLFDGLKYVEAKSLNDLTSSVKTKIKYNKLRGIPNTVIYTGVGIIVVAGLLMGGLSLMEGHSLKQKAMAIKQKQEVQRKMEQDRYEAETKDYNLQMARLQKEATEGVLLGLAGDPNKILGAWYNAVSSHELGTHGWGIGNIECYYNPKLPGALVPQTGEELACDYQFVRNGLTTNRMLVQDYPDAKISGNSALVTNVLKTDRASLTVPTPDILTTLPNAKNWGFDMISQLQLLKIVNIDYDLKASSDVTFQGLPKPLTPQQKAEGKTPVPGGPVSIGLSRGEIVIKSKNLELLKEVADNVDFKAVGVKKVAMKMGNLGEISWDLTLVYYVKSDAGGIVAANSVSLSNSSVPGKVDTNAPPTSGPTLPPQGK
jgi:Pilin accessory protein (PilO)